MPDEVARAAGRAAAFERMAQLKRKVTVSGGDIKGLCQKSSGCWLKHGHTVPCWGGRQDPPDAAMKVITEREHPANSRP